MGMFRVWFNLSHNPNILLDCLRKSAETFKSIINSRYLFKPGVPYIYVGLARSGMIITSETA